MAHSPNRPTDMEIPMIAVSPVKTVSYGTITVTDWQGRTEVPGKLTGPAGGGVPVAAKTFAEAVAEARAVKNIADPGLRAVIDTGDGALMLRDVKMSKDASHLFGSRSYGSATIAKAAPGLLGIFDWAHSVAVTPPAK